MSFAGKTTAMLPCLKYVKVINTNKPTIRQLADLRQETNRVGWPKPHLFGGFL
jgi:preprotein translocase subunit SecE